MASETGHTAAERFDFREDRHTSVIVCARVRDGAPVLHVTHDSDGDWQFLCDGEHGDEGPDGAVVACLECVVAGDPSLNDVADLCCNGSADRAGRGAGWKRHDHFEDAITEAVERHGWFVAGIPAGESEGEPGFAYTIGLHKTYGHPELICVGLRVEVMQGMLNSCGDLIKAGRKPSVGKPFGGVLDDFDVLLREVRARESYDDYLGYAMWFHGGREFAVLQLVWPDMDGRFPGAPDVNPAIVTQQPLLP